MRLYVRTLEEELPGWWAHHTGGAAEAAAVNGGEGGAAPTANGTAGTAAAAPQAGAAPPAPSGPKSRSVAEVVVEGSWVSPYISSDKRPPPRYEHATALVGSELYIIGGNYGGWRHRLPRVEQCIARGLRCWNAALVERCTGGRLHVSLVAASLSRPAPLSPTCPQPGGRYLNDTWALNLENLTWKAFVSGGKSSAALPASSAPAGGAPPPPAPLTPIAGHVVVPWHGSLVLVGGHMKVRGI